MTRPESKEYFVPLYVALIIANFFTVPTLRRAFHIHLLLTISKVFSKHMKSNKSCEIDEYRVKRKFKHRILLRNDLVLVDVVNIRGLRVFLDTFQDNFTYYLCHSMEHTR